jgi:hypothetical protein
VKQDVKKIKLDTDKINVSLKSHCEKIEDQHNVLSKETKNLVNDVNHLSSVTSEHQIKIKTEADKHDKVKHF